MSKKLLVVGGGAREHALGIALASYGHTVVFAPGNAGTAHVPRARNAAVPADDVPALVELAVRERVDLVVIGPEAPLTLGLVDALDARGVRAFGPSRAAARLEGSKVFMKRFLARHRIRTAAFEVFDDADAAEAYVRAAGRPLVVKTDGLAAGKGVVVATTVDEALGAVRRAMRERAFGEAGATVVIEELLVGEEASFHVVCDGARGVALASAQDHKRAYDGDRGPNTGGMGAYAPAPIVTAAVQSEVMRDVVEPTLRGMADEGAPFRGVLFVGLMIDRGVPSVLEFNVRFGDPEACVLLPIYEADPFALFDAAARGDLQSVSVPPSRGAALAVVLAAAGYPGPPRAGDPIEGLAAAAAAGGIVFHAGTRALDGAIVTSGGRVLVCCGTGDALADAARRAYDTVAAVHFAGAHHRKDIGHRALGAQAPS